MAIIIQSGLINAIASVRTYFASNGITATVEAGWKRRAHQMNQGPGGANRVVFTPSADENGGGGELSPPRFPGARGVANVATIRELANWNRRVLVSVWAVDLTATESEEAQIQAVESLLEWTMRAVKFAPGAFADAVWGDTKWTPPQERAFGLEIAVGLTFRHPIFDAPSDLVFPSAAAIGRGEWPPPVPVVPTGDT